MTPGNVKEVNERPNAPTNSKTAAMSSMKIEATMQPMYKLSVSV